MDPPRALTAEALAAVRNSFRNGVPDNILQEAVQALPETYTSEQLKNAIGELLDKQAILEMKQELKGTSLSQVRHMLALAGLPARDWKIMSGFVVIPDTPEFHNRSKMMVSACRYYNGK